MNIKINYEFSFKNQKLIRIFRNMRIKKKIGTKEGEK